MKEYKTYSELLFDAENSPYFSYVLRGDGFSVVYDESTGRYFCFEEGENDADVFTEVKLVARLTPTNDMGEDVDRLGLENLFDCVCSGEAEGKNGEREYLWFASADKAEGIGKRFEIWQLRRDADRSLKFEGYDSITSEGKTVDSSNYDHIYTCERPKETTLNDIFMEFNIYIPEDFKGHSLSVSDVIVEGEKAFYVDTFGFRPLMGWR